MKQIFEDKDGNLSSKRIAGVLLIICSIGFNGFGIGEPSVNIQMLYAGGICLGVTAFEKKSNF